MAQRWPDGRDNGAPSYMEKENETFEPQFSSPSFGADKDEAGAGGDPAEIPVAAVHNRSQRRFDGESEGEAGASAEPTSPGAEKKKGLWTKAKSATRVMKEVSSSNIKAG